MSPFERSVEDAVVDFTRLHRHDALARDVDRDIGEIDSEQQVAAEAADRQLAVQVLLRLANDVRRSQSRNQGVCDTISASASTPTRSVPTRATT